MAPHEKGLNEDKFIGNILVFYKGKNEKWVLKIKNLLQRPAEQVKVLLPK